MLITVFRDIPKLHLWHCQRLARWVLVWQTLLKSAHPAGREDGWSVPATRLSPLRQFDATDTNGSQGRRQIKRGLVIMNSKAQASTQSEEV